MTRRALVLTLVMLVPAGALTGCIGTESADDVSQAGADGDRAPEAENATNRSSLSKGPWNGSDRTTGLQPIGTVFDGSLRHPLTRVLLVPPAHGDLGEPMNDSRRFDDYLNATIEGIHEWEEAIDAFVRDHPEYAYLDQIDVQIDVWDDEMPSTAGYDIVIGYAETSGPAFRGVAFTGQVDVQRALDDAGLGDIVHFGNRYILLSLFASAPRGGQTVPDYPETHEVEAVTMHEFAHTWGMGHSTTWTGKYGPDLMNSPYPFVYGDGEPAGDGGERSPHLCATSLDLYGLAHLYRWLPNGTWEESHRNVTLPADMPYELYCVDDPPPQNRTDGEAEVSAIAGVRGGDYVVG